VSEKNMPGESIGSIQLINFMPEDGHWLIKMFDGFEEPILEQSFASWVPFLSIGLNVIHVTQASDLDWMGNNAAVCQQECQLRLLNPYDEALNELSDYCSETFVIVDGLEDPSLIMKALRKGANDVFTLTELKADISPFIDRAHRALDRCHLLSQGQTYRQHLEKTLCELRDDQEAAYQLQQRILPIPEQLIDGYQYDYSLTPSLIASGDFVDVIQVEPDKTLFYLADVSGHGTSSALITVLLKNLTFRLLRNHRRNSSHDILSPAKTLRRMNSDICRMSLDKHLTIFCGMIDSTHNTMTYSVAGHHPMPIIKQSGKTVFLEGRGLPVGLMIESDFEEISITLDDDFSLTLCSDGVLELLPQKSILDKETALLNWVSDQTVSLEQLESFVMEHHAFDDDAFPGQNDLPDDITIMTIARAQ
jgi:sigma-B regulation protein RsbU (phosphoserine phosphatase)